MNGGYASKQNMANGRGIPYPTPMPKMANIKTSTASLRNKAKMKFSFKQKLRDWLYSDDADEAVYVERDHDRPDFEGGINFRVINAQGGRIVQVHYYDNKTDRNRTSLHLITPDEDLAASLAHILALETLGK
jgi:hypothetical protein